MWKSNPFLHYWRLLYFHFKFNHSISFELGGPAVNFVDSGWLVTYVSSVRNINFSSRFYDLIMTVTQQKQLCIYDQVHFYDQMHLNFMAKFYDSKSLTLAWGQVWSMSVKAVWMSDLDAHIISLPNKRLR